jgi:hypothetical protein
MNSVKKSVQDLGLKMDASVAEILAGQAQQARTTELMAAELKLLRERLEVLESRPAPKKTSGKKKGTWQDAIDGAASGVWPDIMPRVVVGDGGIPINLDRCCVRKWRNAQEDFQCEGIPTTENGYCKKCLKSYLRNGWFNNGDVRVTGEGFMRPIIGKKVQGLPRTHPQGRGPLVDLRPAYLRSVFSTEAEGKQVVDEDQLLLAERSFRQQAVDDLARIRQVDPVPEESTSSEDDALILPESPNIINPNPMDAESSPDTVRCGSDDETPTEKHESPRQPLEDIERAGLPLSLLSDGTEMPELDSEVFDSEAIKVAEITDVAAWNAGGQNACLKFEDQESLEKYGVEGETFA